MSSNEFNNVKTLPQTRENKENGILVFDADNRNLGIVRNVWNIISGNKEAKLIQKSNIALFQSKIDIQRKAYEESFKYSAIALVDNAKRELISKLEDNHREDQKRRLEFDREATLDYSQEQKNISDANLSEEDKEFLEGRRKKSQKEFFNKIDAIRQGEFL